MTICTCQNTEKKLPDPFCPRHGRRTPRAIKTPPESPRALREAAERESWLEAWREHNRAPIAHVTADNLPTRLLAHVADESFPTASRLLEWWDSNESSPRLKRFLLHRLALMTRLGFDVLETGWTIDS